MTSLQVIGAGFGRTGTTSLKEALEELGFTPCHHMDETFKQGHLNHLWKEVYRYKFNKLSSDSDEESRLDDLLKLIFEGYNATVDCPGYMFYDRFLKWNPEAKVILSVRDSPEQYVKSVQSTFFWANKEKSWFKRMFWKFMDIFTCPTHLYWIIEYIKALHDADPTHPDTDLAVVYTEWNNSVIEAVPPEQLLVYNVKEGWEPLCGFLGVEVPDRPFPKRNTSKEMVEAVSSRSVSIAIRRAGKISAGVFVLAGAVFLAKMLSTS